MSSHSSGSQLCPSGQEEIGIWVGLSVCFIQKNGPCVMLVGTLERKNSCTTQVHPFYIMLPAWFIRMRPLSNTRLANKVFEDRMQHTCLLPSFDPFWPSNNPGLSNYQHLPSDWQLAPFEIAMYPAPPSLFRRAAAKSTKRPALMTNTAERISKGFSTTGSRQQSKSLRGCLPGWKARTFP